MLEIILERLLTRRRIEIISINIFQLSNGVMIDYLSEYDGEIYAIRTVACSYHDLDMIFRKTCHTALVIDFLEITNGKKE